MKDIVVPLFCTTELDRSKSFYQEHMGFRVLVEMPGYVELQHGEDGAILAFMGPEEGKCQAASGQGLIYCFPVEDADAEHARLSREGVKILEEPEDRPWGERGFMAADPNGITLYLGHPLPAEVETNGASK